MVVRCGAIDASDTWRRRFVRRPRYAMPMTDAYRFVVIFMSPDGRVTHGLTDDPIRLLAMRVADGSLTAKQAATSEVYSISPATVDRGALESAVAFHRLVAVARTNPDPIRKAILSGEMAPDQLERLRAELMSRVDGDAYAAPWPFREERDVAPEET